MTSEATKPSCCENVQSFSWWFLKTYLGDIIVLVPVSIFWGLLQFYFEPMPRCIPGATNNPSGCNFATGNARDPSLAYPWQEDSISNTLQYAVTMGLWLVPLFAGVYVNRRRVTIRQHGPIFVTLLVQVIAFATIMNQCVGKTIKIFIGFPRPTYYSSLTHNPDQARLSFPSGHAQLSNTLLLLLFYHFLTVIRFYQYKRDGFKVAVTMKPNDDFEEDHLPAGVFFADRFFEFLLDNNMDTLAYFIAFIPVIVGEFIGLSRIIDYAHHVDDVIGGAMLGALLSFLAFNVYYTRIYGTLFIPVQNPRRMSETNGL